MPGHCGARGSVRGQRPALGPRLLAGVDGGSRRPGGPPGVRDGGRHRRTMYVSTARRSNRSSRHLESHHRGRDRQRRCERERRRTALSPPGPSQRVVRLPHGDGQRGGHKRRDSSSTPSAGGRGAGASVAPGRATGDPPADVVPTPGQKHRRERLPEGNVLAHLSSGLRLRTFKRLLVVAPRKLTSRFSSCRAAPAP